MTAIGRREFGGAVRGGRARLADSRLDVLVNEPIGTIAPEIYGHFVEHLGGVVYDGVWVGERSRVPNLGGIRRALVEALRVIHPAVVRWPGGCFADSYDWRDGIGPRERRPRGPIPSRQSYESAKQPPGHRTTAGWIARSASTSARRIPPRFGTRDRSPTQTPS